MQTWQAMRPALPEPAQEEVGRDLYLAGGREVADRVRALDLPVQVVVGHNPTLEQVLGALTGDLRGLRPSAVALVELADGGGTLVELHQPAG